MGLGFRVSGCHRATGFMAQSVYSAFVVQMLGFRTLVSAL